ncbi:MAG: STAS domain-containing protein [Ignavibacteriae bacterium]|nr:STAS domain-containing protein [Ignavibacteriota bacterium]
MNAYTLIIAEVKPDTASIELNEQVLGGNDALEFSSKLYETFDKGINSVIIDLSKVQVMNSSGLGMLVSGLSSLRKNNIQMVLASVPDKVMSLLRMTHLDKVFQIYNNIQDAYDKFS